MPKEICSQCKFPMCSAKCVEEHVKMPECAIMAKHQYFNLSSKFLVLVRTMSRWSSNFQRIIFHSVYIWDLNRHESLGGQFNDSRYSHLSNNRGGSNKRGGEAKIAKSLNVEAGMNIEVGTYL